MVLRGSGFSIPWEHSVGWGGGGGGGVLVFILPGPDTQACSCHGRFFFFLTNFTEVVVLHGGELSHKILQLQMHTVCTCRLLQAKDTKRYSC